MKKGVIALVFSIFSMVSLHAQDYHEKQLLNKGEFKEYVRARKVQLVDVRTAKEFKEGTIEYAQNIDFLNEDFKQNIQELDKNEPVYIFCKSGKRSAAAKKTMEEAGFKTVLELDGGYTAWQTEE